MIVTCRPGYNRLPTYISMGTYIYLNIYPNGLMYVGSHKWSGVGKDPNYFGSSNVAKKYRWKPSRVFLLEELSPESSRLNREGEWIFAFCKKYGISKATWNLLSSASARSWCSQFSSNGRMLNGHNNAPPHDAVSMSKARETVKALGKQWPFWEGRTRDSFKKGVQKRIASGVQARSWEKAHMAATQPIVRSRRVLSLLKKGKGSLIQVWKDGDLLFTGTIHSAREKFHISLSWWRRFQQPRVEHAGYVFVNLSYEQALSYYKEVFGNDF